MHRFEVSLPPAYLEAVDARARTGFAGMPAASTAAVLPAPAVNEPPDYSLPLPPAVPDAQPAITLRSGIPRLDNFFAAELVGGRITLLDGPAEFILYLTSRFAVNGVVLFDRPVMFIDGGNTADPYGFATICRRLHIPPQGVLARIFIARAFTVYQLDTLFAQMVEESINSLSPAVVIVSSLYSMYLDPDVKWDEARMIFENDLKILRDLTARRGVVTLIANHGQQKSYHAMELTRMLRAAAGARIDIKARSKRRLRFVLNDGATMDYMPLPPNQSSLDEFFPGGV